MEYVEGRPTRSDPSGERNLRVLLAEDDAALRDLLSSTLRDEGYEVLEAASVAQALQLVERGPVDLVLTDLGMPNERGDDLVERLLRAAHPPLVVMMTAFPDEATRRRARDLGGTLLEKPFSLEQVRRTVRDATSLGPR